MGIGGDDLEMGCDYEGCDRETCKEISAARSADSTETTYAISRIAAALERIAQAMEERNKE